jgi:tRNA pseudouridine13 synthase
VFKQPAERLAALNERLFGIRIGNFSYVDKPLVLGQLSGNRFSVVLR